MSQPDPPSRIPPLSIDLYDDEVREFFARWTVGPFDNADRYPPTQTFAHHPRLGGLFSEFNIHLLSTSTLPVRQRQIAIMRTAWITKAVYVWSSHLRTSMSFGLEPDMFRPIQNGETDPYFNEFERAIIRATDELVRDKQLGDACWAALAAEWNTRQMLDFLFTVGCYVTVAGVLGSARVEREPELLELAALYGAPEPLLKPLA